MARLLVAASVAWPLLLGASVWARAGSGVPPAWTSLVYLAASRVCHQVPERSFSTAGVQWPVCGRCSGLYLAAPIGAVAALWPIRRRLRTSRLRWVLAAAALPTAVSVGLEWSGLVQGTSLGRAIIALPLGAVIAYVVVAMAGTAEPIG
jgi:uncharacterized membrane protein